MAVLLKTPLPLDREYPASCLPSQLKGMYPNSVELEGSLDFRPALFNLWRFIGFATDLLQNSCVRFVMARFELDLSLQDY